ncbi:hypothetical protein DW209_12985 [Enterobacter hormaechei]|nr:hypothetical protein DW209_12985 [Enterobacter hormaechei]
MITVWTGVGFACAALVEAIPDSINKMPRSSFVFRIAFKISLFFISFAQFALKRCYVFVLRRQQLSKPQIFNLKIH